MIEDQSRFAAELGVAPQFDASAEIARRAKFLAEYTRAVSAKFLVLEISGGVGCRRDAWAGRRHRPRRGSGHWFLVQVWRRPVRPEPAGQTDRSGAYGPWRWCLGVISSLAHKVRPPPVEPEPELEVPELEKK